MRKEIHALSEATWLWGLLAWGYVCVDKWLYSPAQYFPLATYFPLHENYVAGLAFLLSFCAFVAWRLTK